MPQRAARPVVVGGEAGAVTGQSVPQLWKVGKVTGLGKVSYLGGVIPSLLAVCDTEPTFEGTAGWAGMGVVGDGPWLTVGETVERLEGLVSDQTVRRLCKDGTLRSIRIGERQDRRIEAASVDAYLAKLKSQSQQSDDVNE
jgi:excisionase family DNA binding protein